MAWSERGGLALTAKASDGELFKRAFNPCGRAGVVQWVSTQPVAQGHGRDDSQVFGLDLFVAFKGRVGSGGSHEGELSPQSICPQGQAQLGAQAQKIIVQDHFVQAFSGFENLVAQSLVGSHPILLKLAGIFFKRIARLNALQNADDGEFVGAMRAELTRRIRVSALLLVVATHAIFIAHVATYGLAMPTPMMSVFIVAAIIVLPFNVIRLRRLIRERAQLA